MKRSTGVKIEQHGYTKHQLKTMAQQQAERLEALAKGDAVLDKQMDALRAAAEAAGSGRRIPTVYDYITHSYRAEGGEQNISNAKRAHKLFLTHLGSNATKRLDKIRVNSKKWGQLQKVWEWDMPTLYNEEPTVLP